MPKVRTPIDPPGGRRAAPCACKSPSPHERFRHLHGDFSDVDEAFAHVCGVFGSPRFADDWRATWMSEHAMIRRRTEVRENSEIPEQVQELVRNVLDKRNVPE